MVNLFKIFAGRSIQSGLRSPKSALLPKQIERPAIFLGDAMTIGEGLYAHLETEFMRSHKCLGLPLGARWLYLEIWCYALEQRREIIERPSNDYLATISGLRRHPITTYLERLRDSKLLMFNAGYIAVIGLRKKHSRISFKPEFENSGIDFEISQDCSFLSYPSLSYPSLTLPPKEVGTSLGSPPASKPKRTDPKNKKPKPETNPNIKTFIDWYFDEHLARFGTKLLVNGGQDGATVKRMLGSLGIDDLKVRAERFLADPKSWPNGDKSIKFLAENINRYKDEKCDGGREDVDYDALGAPPKRREPDAM